jgi:hypothetical protein
MTLGEPASGSVCHVPDGLVPNRCRRHDADPFGMTSSKA